ncbi:MAG: hypothetical protein QG622_714 [Actinomycetota bacterium]|nr:hypothetical protein [Actinomycetota bacterium]
MSETSVSETPGTATPAVSAAAEAEAAAPAAEVAAEAETETETAAGRTALADVLDVEEALRDVVDPELGINVVDLGLVYGVTIDQDNSAIIDMTLTSAACPLTDVIEDQAVTALEGLVARMRINWVWMPPWGPDKITPEGREQLRALGFNV